MADFTSKLLGNQEPVHAKESRRTDDACGPKKGSPKGCVSPKPRGDIARKIVANAGKNPTRSPVLAMADRTTNLQGNQEPLRAGEAHTSKANRTPYACGVMNGKKQGPATPKPRRNKIANNVTTNKKMDDRVKKRKQANAEGCGAVRGRFEQKRGLGKPLPKRGGVTKAIVREVVVEVVAGVKKVIDTSKAFCCAPEPFDVDAFFEDLPFPTTSEPTATLWAKVES